MELMGNFPSFLIKGDDNVVTDLELAVLGVVVVGFGGGGGGGG